MPNYTEWIWHGEKIRAPVPNKVPIVKSLKPTPATNNVPIPDESKTMQSMLQDVFGMHNIRANDGECQVEVQAEYVPKAIDEEIDESAKKFYSLVQDADKPLHDKTQYSKLSTIVHLYNLKCVGGLRNTIFTSLLEFINEIVPTNEPALPKSMYKTKKYLRELGLGYEKIPACRNHCMLFWKENEKLDTCTMCGASKWKDEITEEDGSSRTSKRRPVKVLRWFPLASILQRLYMSQHAASHMRWHVDGRTKDDVLKHPADGEAWRAFDTLHPNFALDPQNVRLGLASDGFNPFWNMSTSHSTWPVMLVPYNLPPWVCMKQPYFILSMIIPGLTAPGMNIDVYLKPLISKLQESWNVGVQTYDISMKKSFVMWTALMWTISDFPAYADLSGWSTRDELACPCCMHSTGSTWLTYGRKYFYMGHRQWLPANHKWRQMARTFDGKQELGVAPVIPDGGEILRQLQEFDIVHEDIGRDKRQKIVKQGHGANENVVWKKKSIFSHYPIERIIFYDTTLM
ncbi:uncharacterized protein LOC133871588 [Alnus glutinosa]|uniref:uncharacterized protein LOC133871588 n=1 Tax=Alnus glutinosa TaxID=3517 RepID=UPI002D782869|nr:uncharacterized protein LOC133871588 [Alnus glutinosa]